MKRISIVSAMLALCTMVVAADSIKLPKLPETGSSMQDFVPNGWQVKSVAKGQLDSDGKEDLVMVLTSKTEMDGKNDDTEKSPRMLVILTRTKRNGYQLSKASANALLCKNCAASGDSVGDPVIEDGMVKVRHSGGKNRKWEVEHRFQYRDGHWFVVGQKTTTGAGQGKPGQIVDVDYVNGVKVQAPIGASDVKKYGPINFTPTPLTPVDAFNVGMNIENMNNW